MSFNNDKGVSEQLIEIWRTYRGIDRWPIVQGEVISKYWVDGSEGGGYYKLMLQYRISIVEQGEPVLSFATLAVDGDNNHSGAEIGDTIPLRVDPKNSEKAVFVDTSQSAGRFKFVVLALAFFALIATARGCHSFFKGFN
jgi:hypothetical protein